MITYTYGCGHPEHKGKARCRTGCAGWSPAGVRSDFQTRALAESFRSKLVVAQREGVGSIGRQGYRSRWRAS